MFSDLDHERSLKLSLLSLLACLAFLVAPVASAASQPNIVLVFLDNFGWGEPGFNGGGIVRGAATPNLDQALWIRQSALLLGNRRKEHP